MHLVSGRVWELRDAFGEANLHLVERAGASPAAGCVQIRMTAMALNYRDLLMIRGAYNPRQSLPLVPCSDGVGVVTALGEGVTRVAVGDRVCPTFAQAWLGGRPSREALSSTLGGPLDGVLAEQMVVPAEAVVRVPEHLTDAEAATLPCAGVTAWTALRGVVAGDTVVTLGTGGVSTFALQLGVRMGARMVVTSSSDEKLAIAREMGAAFTVNYRTDPAWGKTIARWSGGADRVVELGGAGTLEQSLRAARPGGEIALIGVLDGVETRLPLTRIFMRGLTVRGIFVGARSDLEDLCRALAAHPDLRPRLDTIYPFEALPDALARLEVGPHGKVVLTTG